MGVDVDSFIADPNNHITFVGRADLKNPNSNIEVRVERHTEGTVTPSLLTLRPGESLVDAKPGVFVNGIGVVHHADVPQPNAPETPLTLNAGDIAPVAFDILQDGAPHIGWYRPTQTFVSPEGKVYTPQSRVATGELQRWGFKIPDDELAKFKAVGGVERPVKPVEPVNKPQSVVLPEGQFPTVRVAPSQVAFRPDIMQYKRMDDATTGVNAAEKLSGEWNELYSGRLLLWEPANPAEYGLTEGQRYIVANGHHRAAFALEKGVPAYDAQILHESDGYSAADAYGIAAEQNIVEGKGTIYDAVKFLRNERTTHGEDAAVARARRIGVKGGKAATIAFQAGDDLFHAFVNERISPALTEVIAESAPNNAALQSIGIRGALAGDGAESVRGRMEAAQNATGKVSAPQQRVLFDDMGLEEVWKQQGDYVAARRKELNDIISTRKAVVNKYGAATATKSITVELEKAKSELTAAVAQLQRWEKWGQDPELRAEVENLGKKPAPPPAPVVKPEVANVFPLYPALPEKALPGTDIFKQHHDNVLLWEGRVRNWLALRPENQPIIFDAGNRNIKALTRNIDLTGQNPWRLTNFWHKEDGTLMPSGHEVFKTREAAVIDAGRNIERVLDKLPGRVLTEGEIKGHLLMDEVGDHPLFWYELGNIPLARLREPGGLSEGMVIDSLKDNKIAFVRELDEQAMKYGDLKKVDTKPPPPEMTHAVGDYVKFTPTDPRGIPTEGIIQEIIKNGEGEPGLHILSPLPGDPGRVIRVWLRDGKVNKVEPPLTELTEAAQKVWDSAKATKDEFTGVDASHLTSAERRLLAERGLSFTESRDGKAVAHYPAKLRAEDLKNAVNKKKITPRPLTKAEQAEFLELSEL